MAKRMFVCLAILALVAAFSLPLMAQESAVKGNLDGVILDTSGAVVPGATVTITGPTGAKTATTDNAGNFMFSALIPSHYSVKVEKQGFRTSSLADVEVLTDRTSSVRITLEPGAVTEVVQVSASAITIDTSSSAIGANLNDTFYSKIPIQRNIESLFYLSPGVAGGGASGAANPSISGASGLENQYVADGVDITDTAFGGLGIFTRSYGSLSTGINLSFVKEVDVKTGAFEPQYGKATGGIVQIVTKSGSNELHGTINGYMQPLELEAHRTNPDDAQFNTTTKFGKLLNDGGYDADVELGGHLPGFKDKLFFFGSFNPSETQNDMLAPTNAGLFAHGPFLIRTLSYDYAGKLTYKLNDKNQIETSIFGDPSHTSTGPIRRLRMDSTTGFSKLLFGTRNWATHYNATITPTWLLNASFTWGANHFDEHRATNLNEIIDDTQTGVGQRGEFIPVGLGFIEPIQDNTFGVNADTSKTFHLWGEQTVSIGYRLERSFYDGTRADTGGGFPMPSVNMLGQAVPSPAAGSTSDFEFRLLPAPATCTLCPLMNVAGTKIPVFLNTLRSEFNLNSAGEKTFSTRSVFHAAYVNDSWSPNKYVTLNLGIRWDQEFMHGEVSKWTFTDDWSPRVGVIVDPWGNRKDKFYVNFGRNSYALPLDLAERSFTNELDDFGPNFAPQFTINPATGERDVVINQFGTVNPIISGTNLLNNADNTGAAARCFTSGQLAADLCGIPGGIGTFSSIEAIAPGTRLNYEDEWVAGYEHEFPHGVIMSAKFVRRDLKRIVEDSTGLNPEEALFFPGTFLIVNPSASTDLWTNPREFDFTPSFCGPGTATPVCPAGTPKTNVGFVTNLPSQCGAKLVAFPILNSVGNAVTDANGNPAACFAPTGVNGQVAGTPVPDGIPDGLVSPVHRYTAVEFEVNKSFSQNWQLRANYRIARLFGNYEGALRNDNGQTDPGISSLFDFTPGNFNLLGDQTKPGLLNTDRLHIFNGYFAYVVGHSKLQGLTLGTGIRVQTGTPINRLAAHPVYLNSGEVPLGGRGVLGRTPTTGTVDLHADYPIRFTERARLHLGADVFNIGFARRLLFENQDIDLGFGVPNVDFAKPTPETTVRAGDAFQAPFSARFFARFDF